MQITNEDLIRIIKEELDATMDEVYSEKQRRYMCAMAEPDADRPKGLSQKEAEEMCSGPMKEEELVKYIIEKKSIKRKKK